jgi:hypothetical protein
MLYGLAPHMQILRRDIDSPPLPDEAQLDCDDGDVLHLSVAGPQDLMMTPGMSPLSNLLGGDLLGGGLAEVISGAMNDIAELNQAMQQRLERETYNITFVLPALGASANEKRCKLEISAVARVEEVLDMVKLELDAEDIVEGLEFAGQELPLHAPIHALGLSDGDLVMAMRKASTTSL